MTVDRLPWEEIQTPTSEINRLRVDQSHPHDFFWGKDVSGHYLLVLRFDAALLNDIKIRKIVLTGIYDRYPTHFRYGRWRIPYHIAECRKCGHFLYPVRCSG